MLKAVYFPFNGIQQEILVQNKISMVLKMKQHSPISILTLSFIPNFFQNGKDL